MIRCPSRHPATPVTLRGSRLTKHGGSVTGNVTTLQPCTDEIAKWRLVHISHTIIDWNPERLGTWIIANASKKTENASNATWITHVLINIADKSKAPSFVIKRRFHFGKYSPMFVCRIKRFLLEVRSVSHYALFKFYLLLMFLQALIF